MEKVVYKVGKFIDFAGYEREVVLCAVSQECYRIIGNIYTGTSTIYNLPTWSCSFQNPCTEILIGTNSSEKEESEKVLRLGIAIQNPQDSLVNSNTELAKKIALGKAKNDRSCIGKIYSTKSGFINQKMVEAFLDQELEYFQNAPHLYIKGYKKDKELFESNPMAYYSKFKLNR